MESNRLKEIIAEEIERVLEQEAARIKLTEAKLRKGDLVGVDDEIGVVNKVKGRVAYIKLPSSPGSFHPIEADTTTYKGKHKGKDIYSETKGAPKGHYFTASGNVVKGRSKVPKATQSNEGK